MHLQQNSLRGSFGHLVAVGGGRNDGDVCFGGDVIAHATLRHVSIQLANNDLQVDCTVRSII